MTWTASSESPIYFPEPSWSAAPVSVARSAELGALGVQATAQGYLWIQLNPPGPQHRGRLGLYIEECIETHLEERGALPPGIQASTGLDASLSDQLYRARLVEMRGIALGVPSLEGITNLGRTLDAEDSGVLRWWLAATAERPVCVVLSAENMKLRVYPSPVLFETLFEVAPEPVSPRAPSVSMAESSETMALSDLPPEAREVPDEDDVVSFAEEPRAGEIEESAEASWQSESSSPVELPALDRALGLTPEHAVAACEDSSSVEPHEAAREEVLTASDDSNEATEHDDPAELAAAFAAADAEVTEESCEPAWVAPPARGAAPAGEDRLDAEEFLRMLAEESVAAPPVAPQTVLDRPGVVAESAPPGGEPARLDAGASLPTKVIGRAPFIRMADPSDLVGEPAAPADEVIESAQPVQVARSSAHPAEPANLVVDENDPFVQLARKEWKVWAKNLEAARGPKPLAVVERQFVTDYTRLREAVRRGLADGSAHQVLNDWQESFSTSYSEAFDALRVRGKRPTMVLDVPEIAQRLGRLQGARRVQLLLVDGMRFDLGLMIQERLRARVDAALTERLLLWSALPSITTYQLELLGKGPEGLREECSLDESPALVARGRAASAPRRIRTGRLELFKIDVIEDALREPGLPVQQRLPEIAERASDALADHLSKQAPRTLVLVFGDHGFALDAKASGTTAEVRQGGSTPEEVLVPAFAWLTGAVH